MKKMNVSQGTVLLGTAVLLCLCLTLITDAYGKGKGVVSSIRDGRLERLVNSDWRQMAAAQEVSLGDRLRTDRTAVAVIEFPDVGKFVIGPSSDLELGKDTKDFRTRIARGAVWLKAGLARGSKASITTSIATAGIRGTSFSMVFGEGEKVICVCTCAGEVEALTKTGQKIKVPRGQYLPLASDGPIPAKSETSLPLLEKKGSVFDFCFNCHIVGGKGKLNPDWK
ncbi:MAG: FecR domain-containing protein [Nitrospirae bacterium]|nr:FecR domain-containing protein [Nitrospirota bacterium]